MATIVAPSHRWMRRLVAGTAAIAVGALASPAVAAAPAGSPPIVTCFDQPVTIFAQPGGPTIGTPGPDVILGTAGRDRIDGRGGNDQICSGSSNDQLLGGDGNDLLSGGDGDDILQGQGQSDGVLCGLGTEIADGGAGIDELLPKAACETVTNVP